MCRGEFSAVIAEQLSSKASGSDIEELKEVASPFPCYPVNSECSQTKNPDRKKNLQQTRNDLKWPTTSSKRSETTWNNLHCEKTSWHALKWPIMSMKQPETIYDKLKWPTTSKERPTATCNEQMVTSWNRFAWKLITCRALKSQRGNI